MKLLARAIGWADADAPFALIAPGPLWRPRRTPEMPDASPPAAQASGMALDPAVLEARIHYRVCELRVLAAQTAVDWGVQACERGFAKRVREFSRGLPPPPAYRGSDPDEA